MKLALYSISLLIIFVSCQSKEPKQRSVQVKTANKTSHKIDSVELNKARVLRDFLFQDTLSIDSLRMCVDNRTDLNIAVPFEHNFTTGPFREGSLFYSIFSSSHTNNLEMTALQSLLFKRPLNHREALSLLLQAGADPNPKLLTEFDISPLDIALKSYYYGIPTYDTLIKYGADPKKANLYSLRDNKLNEVYYFLDQGVSAQTINLNVFIQDLRFSYHGDTRNWKEEFDTLMSHDVNPQIVFPRTIGNSPYINKYALEKLLEKGLDLNEPVLNTNEDYWLSQAIRGSNRDGELVMLLVNHGAYKCHNDRNPYDWAEERQFDQKVLDLIEEKIGR